MSLPDLFPHRLDSWPLWRSCTFITISLPDLFPQRLDSWPLWSGCSLIIMSLPDLFPNRLDSWPLWSGCPFLTMSLPDLYLTGFATCQKQEIYGLIVTIAIYQSLTAAMHVFNSNWYQAWNHPLLVTGVADCTTCCSGEKEMVYILWWGSLVQEEELVCNISGLVRQGTYKQSCGSKTK